MTESALDSDRSTGPAGTALPYATPYHSPPNLWAAFILAMVGLGLIVLGGCFLIGIMAFHVPQVFLPGAAPSPWTPGTALFVIILYGLAVLCFVSAAWILGRVCVRMFTLLK